MAQEMSVANKWKGCCALVVVYLLGKVSWPTQAAGMRWGTQRLWVGRGRSAFWDGGIEENEVVGVKNLD